MKKKGILIILTLILVLSATTAFVYGATPSINENGSESTLDNRWEWARERMGHRRVRVREALEDGQITEDEAKAWDDHIDDMEKFHRENSFLPGCGGHRRMHGRHHGRGHRRGFRGNLGAED